MNNDEIFMRKCLGLAEAALEKGNAPVGSVMVKDGQIIAESSNTTEENMDLTNHAEIIVLRQARRILNTSNLKDCTLYSSFEPCPMCSFMIREHKIGRVVFGAYSPNMGGVSRWNILGDLNLSKIRPFFDTPPEVIGGILAEESAALFERFKPKQRD